MAYGDSYGSGYYGGGVPTGVKTRIDVINRAMRRIGVKAEDETLTADQIASVGEVFDMLIAELGTEVLLSFSGEAVPDKVFIALANLLAVEIAPDYGVPPLTTRGTAYGRVLAILRPDDRSDIPAFSYF